MSAKYILSFPFHPDRFNPDSVEQRIALIAAFKAARLATNITADINVRRGEHSADVRSYPGGPVCIDGKFYEVFATEVPEGEE
jgi:hypothetical protein